VFNVFQLDATLKPKKEQNSIAKSTEKKYVVCFINDTSKNNF
jgi:hypothetical protein